MPLKQSTFLVRTLCFSAIAGSIVPCSVFAQEKESVYMHQNLYLVRVKTVEVGTREVAGPSPRSKIPEGRFEVTKVYLGPDWLKKYRFFTCDTIPHQITVASRLDRLHVNVGFEKGAEGLWWVSYDPKAEGGLQPVRDAGFVDAVGIRPFPYQKMMSDGKRNHKTPKDMEASFQEGLAWAEAAEKVYRAKSDKERGEMLRGYAIELSPRAAWAIACLARSGEKELVEFFRKLLANEKQPIASQVVLDGALVSVDGKNWEGSKEQTALYKRWRETYRGLGFQVPVPLQVLDAQRKQRWLPPLIGP